MRSADLLGRLALLLAAVVAVLLSAPLAVTVVLAAAAVAVTAHGLVRRRARGGLDAVLVAVAGTVGAVAVAATVAAAAGVPTRGWVTALGLLGGLALVLERRRAAPAPAANALGRVGRAPLACVAVTVALVALALTTGGGAPSPVAAEPPPAPSTQPAPSAQPSPSSPSSSSSPSTSSTGQAAAPARARRPATALAISLDRVGAAEADVVLRTDRTTGPLEVRTETDGGSLSLPARHPTTRPTGHGHRPGSPGEVAP
ncbi:hypothetical protein GCM10025868_09700 [Angustibacter aerolatus]|uniref:Uncharacterized protein n=1 Tax=Angustibacter aerolatus TaxID=1162965 RepID=A0ABQ6JFW7_9ACTN|nr:hypothetical protein [Angustibacter aerolatus]GMA85720.1 hypothetical protein GCM10025868_09700 [Angustibacter aerolatus]